MCMAGHITSDAAQDLRGSHDHALEAPWDLSDFFIQWPEKLQLNIKSSTSMKKCWPPEIDKSLEGPQKSFMPSVQFSRSVLSGSLWPHGLQHARPPCPSPTHGVYSNSCPLSRWYHPNISSYVVPFSFCPQSFPASVFSNESAVCIRLPKYWSLSFSISPSNEYSGLIFFRMDWLELLVVQGTLKGLLQHHSSKAWILLCSAFFIVQLSHPYWLLEKPELWLDRLFCWQSNVCFLICRLDWS